MKNNSAIGRSWEELETQIFTPEEIEKSELNAASIKSNDNPMKTIKYIVEGYDFRKEGGYGFTVLYEETFTMTLDDLIMKLMEEFDNECGQGTIWDHCYYDINGDIEEFIFSKSNERSKSFTYRIID